MLRRTRDFAAPIALTVLVYAGYFKATPLLDWLPVDLTALGLALTSFGVLIALIGTFRLPSGFGLVILVWLTFLLGLENYTSGYGSTTIARLYSVTLLATLGPLFLVRTPDRQRVWVWAQVAVGVLLAIEAYLHPSTVGTYSRLSVSGSTAIAAGRAAGVAVVACIAIALTARGVRRRLVIGSAGILLVIPLLGSGSRGPVAAAVIALLVLVLFAPTSHASRAARLAISAVGIALIFEYVRNDTSAGVGRITSTLLAGNLDDNSSQARVLLWKDAFQYIQGHPFGSGWGSLTSSKFDLLGSSGLSYPHNILLETTAEAGWLAGLMTLVFLWSGLRRLRRQAIGAYPATLFAIAIFTVVNALVSGDINDNRMMWAAVAFGWISADPLRRREPGDMSRAPASEQGETAAQEGVPLAAGAQAS